MNVEISVVLPCLNEEETIGACIEKSKKAFEECKMEGEVIVVDNGSTDKSVEISLALGARVVKEEEKGYGSALRRGIEESKGYYIVMGDADDTYDYLEMPKFIKFLKLGYDLVMGSRFKGEILPGAMTWSHRYIGNPILSGMLRLFFGGTVSDSHCGLRAFTKDAYKKMNLHTTGMEFASEMVIHSMKKKLKITEVTITYYPRKGESKLSSLRDAWRHMRFMLLYSPNNLFLLPGALMFLIGTIASIKLLFGPIYLAGRTYDIHVMMFSGLLMILGWQIFNIGITAKIYAHQIGLEESSFTTMLITKFSLERSMLLGGIFLLTGLGIGVYVLTVWVQGGFGFGAIVPAAAKWAQLKTTLLSLVFITLGIQTIFSAFLSSMLQIKYK
ncbi:MAG: hypothetical protein A2252_00475 [Elusimicrobia bacterium RIFOXYA2_FULL_39_19]|nr:MAG: hypothetical protein A2252_00475 [Elusimicrobia bacterium RIFOXYA2_FULL_39_19]